MKPKLQQPRYQNENMCLSKTIWQSSTRICAIGTITALRTNPKIKTYGFKLVESWHVDEI